MGKRLPWRKSNGRFSRPPSLERLGFMWVCRECGGIHAGESDMKLEACRRCGAPRPVRGEEE